MESLIGIYHYDQLDLDVPLVCFLTLSFSYCYLDVVLVCPRVLKVCFHWVVFGLTFYRLFLLFSLNVYYIRIKFLHDIVHVEEKIRENHKNINQSGKKRKFTKEDAKDTERL